MGVVSIQKPSP